MRGRAPLEQQCAQAAALNVPGNSPRREKTQQKPGLSPSVSALTPICSRRSSSPEPAPCHPLGSGAEQILLSVGCLVWRHRQLLLQVPAPLPARLPHRPGG